MSETDNRASKRQRELLSFVDGFIKGNGYGPSYREIMRALGYKSVSTVATHIDGLIAKGYLVKRDNSARSLEIVSTDTISGVSDTQEHKAWLLASVKNLLSRSETSHEDRRHLIQSLRILGMQKEYEELSDSEEESQEEE